MMDFLQEIIKEVGKVNYFISGKPLISVKDMVKEIIKKRYRK